MNTGLIVTSLIAASLQILAPLALGVWAVRRWRVPWRLLGFGVAIFMVFQVLTRMPAIALLESQIAGTLQVVRYRVAWIIIGALTAGLFEEGGRYLGYRFLWKKDRKTWPGALLYGAGHGGVESILVGLVTLYSVVQIVAIFQVDPATLPADQSLLVYQAREQVMLAAWWLPLLSALERLMALVLQVSFSVLVLQCFTQGKFRWWWIALGLHTAIDLIPLLLGEWISGAMPEWAAGLVIEASLIPFALLGLWIIFRLRPKGEEAAEIVPAASAEPARPAD